MTSRAALILKLCNSGVTENGNKENDGKILNTGQKGAEIVEDDESSKASPALSQTAQGVFPPNEIQVQQNCAEASSDDQDRASPSVLLTLPLNPVMSPIPSTSGSNRPIDNVHLNEDGDFNSDDSGKDPNYCSSSSSSSSTSSRSSTSSSSSSSSDSEDNSTQDHINSDKDNIDETANSGSNATQTPKPNSPKKKTRKRLADPKQWKQNQIKRLRNSGKAYKTKKDKPVRAKEIQPACDDKCRHKCSSVITEEKRKEIFEQYWALEDIEKQRQFINKHMQKIKVKYRYTMTPTGRGNNHAFYFEIDGELKRVCKKMFRSTLDINDRTIRTVIAKRKKEGFLEEDLRGWHSNHKAVDPSIKDGVRDHIRSIPRIESHYLRQQTSREFIDGGKTLTDLHKDYMQLCKDANVPYANLVMYSRIFNTEFNIGFFVPKKDQCELCVAFENATGDDKKKLEDKFQKHHLEKRLSREDKDREKAKISETYIVCAYDLHAVLQVPRGDVSVFYYKSKLNNLNLTVTKLKEPSNDTRKTKRGDDDGRNGTTDCFFWHEGEGNRGSDEIGSCILKFIEMESARHECTESIDFVFFSDNCCGQNKNKFIVALYMFAVMNFANVNSITHKFLITGHTQNEGDSVHSVIEKQIKRSLKSGPIYVPNQYAQIIRDAKKTGEPFRVHELSHMDFMSLKHLANDIGLKNMKRVKITDIKVLQFTKDDPTVMKYKLSYSDENFSEVSLIKRCELPQLRPAYPNKLEIKPNKKTDLTSLVNSHHIPYCHADFYNSL